MDSLHFIWTLLSISPAVHPMYGEDFTLLMKINIDSGEVLIVAEENRYFWLC